MAVPEYEQLMLPILVCAAEHGGEVEFEALKDLVAENARLHEDEVSAQLPSGRGTVLDNHLHWGVSYLLRAGLIEKTGPKRIALTAVGYDALAQRLGDADQESVVMRYRENTEGFAEAAGTWPQYKTVPRPPSRAGNTGDEDPQTEMQRYADELYAQLRDELLNRIHLQSPDFFERLIIDLFLAMGYGQGRKELSRQLGKSNDGGVDGVILQDALGLSRIYLQAKRYRPDVAVPVSAVRDFAGSIESHKAAHGLMVTTSYFPKSAVEFVSTLTRRVVLIDGQQLADLLIAHDIGVTLQHCYELKKIEPAYFEDGSPS